MEEVDHNLQVSSKGFLPILYHRGFSKIYLSCHQFSASFSVGCVAYTEKLLFSALPENCTMTIKDRSYCKKNSNQMYQISFENGCHFLEWNRVMHRGYSVVFAYLVQLFVWDWITCICVYAYLDHI